MHENLIEHLRAQPEDFVLDWYCDGMDRDKAWDNAWVDVMIGDRLAWVITSGLLEDDDDEFIWPPDMVAHCLFDPRSPDPFVGMVPTPLQGPVPDYTLNEIRWAASKVSSEAYWTGVPCWSANEINRAIEDWCMIHVGRPIQARWDVDHGPSPTMTKAVEMMEAMKAGIEPKYLLHPGENEGGSGYSVYVSEQVMELLTQELLEDDND